MFSVSVGCRRSGERSPGYLRTIRAITTKHFGPIADVSIHRVTYGIVEDWSAGLKVAPATRKNILGVLHALLAWLERRDEIAGVPRFPEISVPRKKADVLSIEEQEAVLEAVPEPERGAFFLMAEQLARPGEAMAVNVGDYHAGIVTIAAAMKGVGGQAIRGQTKEGDERRRQVSPRLSSWIHEHGGRFALEPLFQNPRGHPSRSRRWTYEPLRATWKRATARADVRPINLYNGTKHTTATALREMSYPLDLIQKACGHAQASSTERYANASDARISEALLRVRWGQSGDKSPVG